MSNCNSKKSSDDDDEDESSSSTSSISQVPYISYYVPYKQRQIQELFAEAYKEQNKYKFCSCELCRINRALNFQ